MSTASDSEFRNGRWRECRPERHSSNGDRHKPQVAGCVSLDALRGFCRDAEFSLPGYIFRAQTAAIVAEPGVGKRKLAAQLAARFTGTIMGRHHLSDWARADHRDGAGARPIGRAPGQTGRSVRADHIPKALPERCGFKGLTREFRIVRET